VFLALLSLSACSTTTTTWTRISSSVEANRLIREANGQLRDGNPAAAARILDDAVRRFPDASGHDQALYDLARALVLSANGGRDYRQASAHLDRLLREYPTSSYVPDARALRIALGAYVARSAELDRLLERLRAIDLEYERPRQP
jgi:outer membrane protein assembly factor BamD (BamD/ComL family)